MPMLTSARGTPAHRSVPASISPLTTEPKTNVDPVDVLYSFREERDETLTIVAHAGKRSFDIAALHHAQTESPAIEFRTRTALMLTTLEKLCAVITKLVVLPATAERSCLVCGCTEDNCRQCTRRTGKPCHWIARRLCSACAEEGGAL